MGITLTSPPKQTLYFAYGSNLSPTQMHSRCPSSPLHTPPLATLKDHEWFIGERGYANIRPCPGREVVGLLYVMDPGDEEGLDEAEGVPWAYERRGMGVEVLGVLGVREVRVLVYLDPRKGSGRASEEYIERLRRGREESGELGLVVGDTWGEGWDGE
ncbi:hypothetical protein VC83_00524 [Pseudogymnoascus destructans]|uniref:gamma-glutamylcyclotransferase n=1 Tax=Pseudogymnoascus destructans TaxID=655981 RepID=A0A177APN2_9PEZI|nr:uncharacterized protein VC83_00524 [Pseudogymnoascus destructans]OAF63303.1 hypothetical protein VC83_00524 [Pseudogymnoascus destructans]